MGKKLEIIKITKCCNGEVYFNHATGDYCCSICTNPVLPGGTITLKVARKAKGPKEDKP